MNTVVGLGFGDEGKGLATSYLVEQTNNPIVVRFNGGHQAGHTVVVNGERHVFSSFGSGTLQGVPTYWSKNCTIYPMGLVKEYSRLEKHEPILYVHPHCPITTPIDVAYGQTFGNKHGTVGVGFGTTLEREQQHFHLLAQDLFHPDVLMVKLRAICDYYNESSQDFSQFLTAASITRDIIRLSNEKVLEDYNPVFEGAQGILLDQTYGFFPHVTRSNCTSRNAVEMGAKGSLTYVTRCYQTRHGKGPMTNGNLYNEFERINVKLRNNNFETNQDGGYQGQFRTTPLDIDQLNYSLHCDSYYSNHLQKNLLITCCDQVEEKIPVTINRKVSYIKPREISGLLRTKFQRVQFSYGPNWRDIRDISEI